MLELTIYLKYRIKVSETTTLKAEQVYKTHSSIKNIEDSLRDDSQFLMFTSYGNTFECISKSEIALIQAKLIEESADEIEK